ncbi:hypothetical protein BDV95DRAFT_600157 [Massariosphaeria phaeospora]|uniref:Uncharacterized protein n=1 Tax=Massariosphaeria phaeospora TaxID=100035 RepID=A0A7C8M0E9_9PLEO|nr:hypothetical protein BDV95DRAFT_600157 [Massariosphaeria phaeospora]
MGGLKRQALDAAVDGSKDKKPRMTYVQELQKRFRDKRLAEGPKDGPTPPPLSPSESDEFDWDSDVDQLPDERDDSGDEYNDESDESDKEVQDEADDDFDLSSDGRPKRTRKHTKATDKAKQAKVEQSKLVQARKQAKKQQIEDNKRLSEEQVEFVMHARDNNKPDPFGTHSTTAGPLVFNEVAAQYNRLFGTESKSAAMEKRYRLRKAQYYAANPTYPQNIIYAAGPPKPKRVRKSVAPSTRPPRRLGVKGVKGTKGPKGPNRAVTRGIDTKKKSDYRHLRPRADLVEAGGLDHYVNAHVPAPKGSHAEWMTILVENREGRAVGRVDVLMRHARKSSGWVAEVLATNRRVLPKIVGVDHFAVDRYVQCVSPKRLGKLPTYDFALTFHENENGIFEKQAACRRIDWDFKALAELYSVAAQFEDKHVHNLVLNHWRIMCAKDVQLEIDPSDLDNLYRTTQLNDPAQDFWAHLINAMGHVEVFRDGLYPPHPIMRRKLNYLVKRGLSEAPTELSFDNFCKTYHFHRAGAVCKRQKPDGPALPDFHAIARRLLITKLREIEPDEDDDADEESLEMEIADIAETLQKAYNQNTTEDRADEDWGDVLVDESEPEPEPEADSDSSDDSSSGSDSE